MYITTGEKEAGHLVERARNLAETTGGTYVPRKKCLCLHWSHIMGSMRL